MQRAVYLRIWWRFVVQAFVREAEYRVNFLVGVGEGVAQLAVAVVLVGILYQYTSAIAGWSAAEVLILVGIYRFVEGIINLQIAPNMLALAGYVRTGEMDFFLLRPISSQFFVSTRRLTLPEAVNALIGLGLAISAAGRAGVRWQPLGVAEALVACFCGILLLYAVWFLIASCAFWLIQVGNLDALFYSAFETARYPVSFFGGTVRALLTFAFPVAFATTIPAEALLGRADPRLIAVGVAMTIVALAATHVFWSFAIRHYGSASS